MGVCGTISALNFLSYPVSGSFLWSASGSGCDTFSVLAATDDGDTLTQDVNYCGSVPISVNRGLNVNLVGSNPTSGLTLSLDNSAGSNVSYIQGDGQRHQVTVSGGSNAYGTFQIGAFADDGTPLGYAFQVDVKPPLARTLFFYSIGDSTEGLTVPSNQLPTQNSLQTQFNRIFPRQTNVTFNFQYGGSYSDHYDLDGDHKMHFDTLPIYNPPAVNEEGQLFHDFFQNPAYQGLRNNAGNTFAFYVNAISPDPAGKIPGGMSITGAAFYPAIVGADWSTPKVNGYTENLTAHELGHILGRGAQFTVIDSNNNAHLVQKDKHNSHQGYLMYESNFNDTPCRISRDEWNMMNFVQGSPITGRPVQNP